MCYISRLQGRQLRRGCGVQTGRSETGRSDRWVTSPLEYSPVLGTVSGTARHTAYMSSNSTPTLRHHEGRRTDNNEEKLSVWLCHTDTQGKGWWQKLLPLRFCLVLFFSFEIGYHCVALAGGWPGAFDENKVSNSSQRLDCVCLLSAGIKGEHAHAYLLCGSLIMILFIDRSHVL